MVAGGSGLPQVVPAAEDEVGAGVEGGAHAAQVAVAAGALQTVLVPVPVQRLQHEAVPDLPVAAGAAPRFFSGLEGHERHAWRGGGANKNRGRTGRIRTEREGERLVSPESSGTC